MLIQLPFLQISSHKDWVGILYALKFCIFPKVLSLLYVKIDQVRSFFLSLQHFKNIATAFPTEKTDWCGARQRAKNHVQRGTRWSLPARGTTKAVQTEVEYYSSFTGVSCIFPTILQSNQQLGAADWKTRGKTCLDGYFVSSSPQKLYSPFWGYFRCCTACPSNRSNPTCGHLSKIVWITALLSTHPFLNAELWLVPGTPLLPRAVLSNMKNWEHLTSGEWLWSRISLALVPTVLPLSSSPCQNRVGNKMDEFNGLEFKNKTKQQQQKNQTKPKQILKTDVIGDCFTST